MQAKRFLQQIEFIKEIDKVKLIQRKTKLLGSDRHENDAEHSWHLAMMALILLEYSNEKIDLLKVLKMVLIHDIVEIDSGDIFLFDTVKNHDNPDDELIAARRIFGLLPAEQATELMEIWQEFEAGETNEAKFAKAIDRFEPILQNHSNNGGSWAEFKVEFEKVHQRLKSLSDGSRALWDYSETLLDECRERGDFDA
jgi:putative hydrolase of HD superfamily